MSATCNTCNQTVSTVRDVRGCETCKVNGTAGAVHCRFRDDDSIEEMVKEWHNPPFTFAAAEVAQPAAADPAAEKEKSLAEEEAKEVAEEIEMAAGILIEDPSSTALELAENINSSHRAYAVEILEERIGKRAAEIKENADALAARFNRDIDDRARLVVDEGQLIGDAAAAIVFAHPTKDGNEVLELLGTKVKAIQDARQKPSADVDEPAQASPAAADPVDPVLQAKADQTGAGSPE